MELGGKNFINIHFVHPNFSWCSSELPPTGSYPSVWFLSGTSAFDLNIMLEIILRQHYVVTLDILVCARTLFHSPNIWNGTLLKADSAKEGVVLSWMLRLRGFTQIRTQPFKSSPIGTRSRRTTQTWSYVPFVLCLQGSLHYYIELPRDSLISYPGLPHAFDRLKWMLRHHSQGSKDSGTWKMT